jgi:hypothetical protein
MADDDVMPGEGARREEGATPGERAAPVLGPGRYQTWDGRRVILLYRLHDHWYGHFADKDPKHHLEKWNRDGAHVGHPGWNLKIVEFDD